MLFGWIKKNWLGSSNHVLDIPMSGSLSYWWNLGSILGITLTWQLATGLLLVIFYTCDALEALASVEYIIREVNSGWFLRVAHLNGASGFFVLLYLHLSRGILFSSLRLWNVWTSGMILFVLIIGEAFLGYVLPWGQISVWGACVITSLLSVIPLIGEQFVTWIWGGFVVNSATLGCLFILHYLLPFIAIGVVVGHLFFLHESGSSNSWGSNDSDRNINFYPFFVINDLSNLICWGFLFCFLCYLPFSLGDCENLKEANLISSPVHIQPEWYFLFLYAILRAVPNKLGGVILLGLSLCCIWIICFFPHAQQSNQLNVNQFNFSILASSAIVLTFLGCSPVEAPLVIISQGATFLYFFMLASWWICWSLLW